MSETIAYEQLICKEGGHPWERPTQRGKKPHFCPAHKPVKTPAKPRDKGEQTEKMQTGKKKIASAIEDAINLQVEAVLAGSLESNARMKLEYVHSELGRPDGPRSGDLTGLRRTRRDLMRQIGKPLADAGSEAPEKAEEDDD